jgi:hypothetical protein
MKKFSFSLLLTVLMLTLAVSGTALGASTGAISASDYKAGDTVTIEGSIDPGQDLYITIAQKTLFAPKDTTGSHEVKRLAKDAKKANFSEDTAIPPLFYVITTNPGAFGKEGKKRFGGPSVLLGKGGGIYNTTMYYLKKSSPRSIRLPRQCWAPSRPRSNGIFSGMPTNPATASTPSSKRVTTSER